MSWPPWSGRQICTSGQPELSKIETDIHLHNSTSFTNTKSKPVRGCVEYLGDGLQHQVEQVAAEGVPGGGGVVAQAEEVEPPKIQNV